MVAGEAFPDIFERLKAVLEPYADEMIVRQDTDDTFYLDTRTTMRNGKPLFFGSVRVSKSYVSFHLMPVYVFPDLLDDIGDLRKRMQGKSCFNFRSLDDEQVEALTALTRAGYEMYRDAGMLGGR